MENKKYVDYFNYLYEQAPQSLKDLIDATKNVEQSHIHHPEGNVYIHIKIVTNRVYNSYQDNNLTLVGLFHDLGKIQTTRYDEKKNTYTAHGHEDVSSIIVDDYKEFIISQNGDYELIKYVVENHMRVKFLNDFKINTKVDFFDNPLHTLVLKFNTCDYGGDNLYQREVLDTTDIQNRIIEYKEEVRINKIVSDKFNGNIVMGLYPNLKGKELGGVLNHFKNDLNTDFKDFVLSNDQTIIIERFHSFMKLKGY